MFQEMCRWNMYRRDVMSLVNTQFRPTFFSISMIPKHTHQSSRVCCLSGIITCKIDHLCSLLDLIPALDYPIALLFPNHLVVSTFWVLCVTTLYASPYETCTCASPGGTERHTERQMHIPLYRSTCAGRCLVVHAVCRCCRTACKCMRVCNKCLFVCCWCCM